MCLATNLWGSQRLICKKTNGLQHVAAGRDKQTRNEDPLPSSRSRKGTTRDTLLKTPLLLLLLSPPMTLLLLLHPSLSPAVLLELLDLLDEVLLLLGELVILRAIIVKRLQERDQLFRNKRYKRWEKRKGVKVLGGV